MQYIIAGLGNPEKKYDNTRHNVGFQVIDQLGKILNIEIKENKFNSLFTQTTYSDKKLFLAKPLTYMNLSGKAIAEIKNFYKIDVENLIVVHDELDLEFGEIKIKQAGGSAGHNGLKSIVSSLGSNNFIRLRVGIGRPPENQSGANYVLGKFSKAENEVIEDVLNKTCDAVLEIINSDVKTAMNKFNSKEKN